MDTSDLIFEVKMLKLKVRDQRIDIVVLTQLIKELVDAKYQDAEKPLNNILTEVKL